MATPRGIIRRYRRRIGSCWRKLSPGRQALLVLPYLRKGETFAELAAGFGIGTATASRPWTQVMRSQYGSGISREVNDMTRMPGRETGSSGPAGAGIPEVGEQERDKPAVGRRALLTRGGVVAAGVVGAGVAGAAIASPASAQPMTAVLMNTANDATTDLAQPTELDADNATAPAFIVKNTGIDTTNAGAGPNLRLTPNSGATGLVPTASTTGGDLTATGDGFLWFTHAFPGATPSAPPVITPAPVLTLAIGNAYAQLEAAKRILDTRSASGRASILNPPGNLDSLGRLKAGKTIYINLDSLVFFADAVFANVTVLDEAAEGYLTIWSGAGTRPLAAAINFQTRALSNFLASGVAAPPATISTTVVNVIAIFAAQTTHVILDVAGFTVPELGFARFTPAIASSSRNARLELARQAMRNAKQA